MESLASSELAFQQAYILREAPYQLRVKLVARLDAFIGQET